MPLETATYTSDLVTSNPAHTDGLSQADSHMRLLKSTIKATFPNFTAAALASTQAQLDAAVSYTTGATAYGFKVGTALLPGLFPLGNPNTGLWSPATNQLAISLNGVQVWLMGGTSIVTTLGVAAAAFTTTGAYSGGTGQLVPIGAVLEWYDDVLPTEGGYVWANGQAISRAAYPILWARWGTRFGAGDGTTTFNVMDRRDTVAVGKSTMGGVASRALQTLTNTVLGTLFGLAGTTLLQSDMPNVNLAGVVTDNGHTHGVTGGIYGGTTYYTNYGNFSGLTAPSGQGVISISSATTGISVATRLNGNVTQTVQNNVQPSTTANFILRAA